jgi:hypothetical protein
MLDKLGLGYKKITLVQLIIAMICYCSPTSRCLYMGDEFVLEDAEFEFYHAILLDEDAESLDQNGGLDQDTKDTNIEVE